MLISKFLFHHAQQGGMVRSIFNTLFSRSAGKPTDMKMDIATLY